MTGEKRREAILQRLQEQGSPLSGTALAQQFGVSRQIIVQDIALMRAENHPILATNKGYLIRKTPNHGQRPKRVFCVSHETSQVLDEFFTVLELGGVILDVAVEHELYGQIRVDLIIENRQDAEDFVRRMDRCQDNPLKTLTGDSHYHTVAAPTEKLLDLIEQALQEKGYLVK